MVRADLDGVDVRTLIGTLPQLPGDAVQFLHLELVVVHDSSV